MTGKQLTIYGDVDKVRAYVEQTGSDIAKSRMFGCDSVEQGRMFALECFARGIPPFQLIEVYHVISGELSKRTNAQLGDFRRAGNHHQIIIRTPEKCGVRLIYKSGEYEDFYLTWEELSEEAYTKTKKGDLKENYSTPRRRMQMLWQRVVSDAITAFAPEFAQGTYSVAEVIDYTGSPALIESVETPEEEVRPGATTEDAVIEPVVDPAKNPKPEPEPKSAPKPEPEPDAEPSVGFSTQEQRDSIEAYFDRLGLSAESRSKVLRKRQVDSLRSLTQDQAHELLSNLVTKLEDMNGREVGRPGESIALNTDPVTPEKVVEIKAALRELHQTPGFENCVVELKQKLADAGVGGLKDLCQGDADYLLTVVGQQQIRAFFERSLTKAKVSAPFCYVADDPQLRPLCQKFGARRVWQAGINELGYPPTWKLRPQDLILVIRRLNDER